MKKITIVSSRDQKKYVLETEANTMAELTAAMDAAGISYQGMTLYEGLTKAEYNPARGEAILPHDVPYKGTTTNDLVFMLTAPQKKVASGAMTYSEMKAYIKDNNLTEAFKQEYGKNYTQGSTSDFASFIERHQQMNTTPATAVTTGLANGATLETVIQAIHQLLYTLVEYNVIEVEDQNEITRILGAPILGASEPEPEAKAEPESPYSNDELDEMFR